MGLSGNLSDNFLWGLEARRHAEPAPALEQRNAAPSRVAWVGDCTASDGRRRLKILGVLHLLRVTSNSGNYFHLYTADPLLLLSQKVLNI